MYSQISQGIEQVDTVNFTMIECCKCGIPFFMTESHRKSFTKNGETFYCPNGHPQWYGKSEADKLKEKLQQLEVAHKNEIYTMQDKVLDAIGEKQRVESKLAKADKQIKRIHKGVCPCCNRSFVNLQRHMQTKHPDAIK